MTLQRMDNVGIAVDDLEAAIAFFTELGMELEGEARIEGVCADRMLGLAGVRSTRLRCHGAELLGVARAGGPDEAGGLHRAVTRRPVRRRRIAEEAVSGAHQEAAVKSVGHAFDSGLTSRA
ncbi:VOC family protein [Streptomyces sp. SP2-10]|uniref:VOC family protein n=1 Tax=Streptomyces sp. SP2-10 TaxID=2873385 RepID=UPI0027DFB131|nr:VOC family protein [Streptomyces sp. SP2-10]